ncbi:elongation factor 1-alpha [Sulfolobales archaeon HS-7]|nr:elongation factor 1-alpha [Sulfolobales archaeon HS-7]
MPQKPHLNLIVIGHIDHGKSTLVGNLLLNRGFIDEKTLKEAEEAAKKLGKDSDKVAFLLDRMKEERERGITINLSFMKFETKKYFFTIIDAPGHRDFVKNMITGTSQADAAILVVSARKGEFEAGMSSEGQTREHALLAKVMGVSQLIVAINKIDATEPPYDQKRYNEVMETVKRYLEKEVVMNMSKVRFVPVSALTGDNLYVKSDKMPWYNGPTLEELLDTLEIPPKPIDKPLRMPITEVISVTGVGTVVTGRVETGALKTGDKVVILPSGKATEVRTIETHHERVDKAEPGDNVGVNLRGLTKNDVKRGDVIGHPDNPPTVADEFDATLFIVWHPTAIPVGYTPYLHVHEASVSCKIVQIKNRMDNTGKVIEENPKLLKRGDLAMVTFKPLKPVVVEKVSEFPKLGRFAIRDMSKTVGVGTVTNVKPAKIEIK